MGHCFIHAPPQNGAQGIILFHEEKKEFWRHDDIERICRDIAPRHDPRDLVVHAERNVTIRMISEYQLRRERRKMQRYSLAETFEEIDFDSWNKILSTYYPERAAFVRLLTESAWPY